MAAPGDAGGRGGRPRVLMLVDRLDDGIGGGERTALQIATGLPPERFSVLVCTTRTAGGAPLRRLQAAGVRHMAITRRRRFDPAAMRTLWRILRDGGVDVVHAHMFGSNVWGTLLGRLAGVPVVVAHEHSWSYEGQPVRRLLDGLIGRLGDAFVAVSHADAALMTSVERVPARKVHVIPSALDARVQPPFEDLRRAYGIPQDAPVVGTVAVLRRVKRLELLVEAFATVLRTLPDAWLFIGGGGDDEANIRAAAEAHGVAHRLVITGLREDVENLWRVIDVAAMTSDREGTPVAALEALAHGVPMVAPAVGGIPDVLQDGAGVLVARHDTAALARELLRLLHDPELRARVGARGRERASEYDLMHQVARCAALYEQLLAAPAARRRARRRDRRLRRRHA